MLARAVCFAICVFALVSGLAAETKVEIENEWVRVTRSVPGPFYSKLPVVDVALNGSVGCFRGKTKHVYENGEPRFD